MVITYAVLNVALVVSVAFRLVRCVQITGTGVGIMVIVTSAQAHNELWPWLVLGVSISCISLTYRPNWSSSNDNRTTAGNPTGDEGDRSARRVAGRSFFEGEDGSTPTGYGPHDTNGGLVRSGSRSRHRMP